MTANEYYLADKATSLTDEGERTRLIQRLRQYLELRNLTLLIGNGCSIPLGAPTINNTSAIRTELDQPPHRLTNNAQHDRARTLLGKLLALKPTIGIEPLLTILTNVQANADLLTETQSLGTHNVTRADAFLLEQLLKKWLYNTCKALNTTAEDNLHHHEELLRRVLLRSTALPRAKIFTTNYDLLLERALDSLGILYFDGFLGTINRTLRTESYHYDLYYPGETTEGRVSRVDRVLHLYKLHGSTNWRRRHDGPEDVIISHTAPNQDDEYGDVMIYPSPLKVTEMNGYPYAEMFRHFSTHIHQPQSALLTIGYKFQDQHINRLIYQALSIPSFVLIIVTPTISTPNDEQHPREEHEIWRLIHHVKSNRILVITGAEKGPDGKYASGAGTIQDFSTTWMPDIQELNVDAAARREARDALTPLTEPQPLDDMP
jgi:hypothetical protein